MLFLEHFLEEILAYYFQNISVFVIGGRLAIILGTHSLHSHIFHKLDQVLRTDLIFEFELPQLKTRIICFGEDDFE